jgi:hypothetical protein
MVMIRLTRARLHPCAQERASDTSSDSTGKRSLPLLAGVGLRLLGEGVVLLPLPGVLRIILLICFLST